MQKELKKHIDSKINAAIVEDLHQFRAREKELVTTILHYLSAAEDRKIFAELSYSSMNEFCMEELGYSKDEAYLRVQAMRLLKAIPETEKLLEEGSLSLTVAARAQIAFKQENAKRKEEGQASLTIEEKTHVLLELESEPTRKADRILATHFPVILEAREVTKAIDSEHDYIGFAADKESRELFEKLKGILGHKNYEGRWDLFFKEIAKIAQQQIDPEAKAQKAAARSNKARQPKPQSNEPTKPIVAQRPHITAAIERKLWLRSGGQCEYTDPVSGRRCSSRHALETDHIIPWARGGSNEFHNLRKVCDVHNRYLAESMGLKFNRVREPTKLYAA